MVHCFMLNGKLECFDLPVEIVKIRLPWPEPDPPPWYDIRTIQTLFEDVVGDTSTTWYMGDATGEHTYLIDLEAGQIIDLSDQAGGPGGPGGP